MPRYRLVQTQEAAGRDRHGMHIPPVVYWDAEHPSDDAAVDAAHRDLPAPSYRCDIGWYAGAIDFYDVDHARQREGEGTHIATLTRVEQ